MKKFYTFLFFFAFLGLSNAQQASDYFPSQTGFEWNFKAIPLDSVSDPINALAYYRIDKFESVANYNGRSANIVQTKSGLLDSILFQPYQDSLFYSTEGTTGYEYFNIRNIKEILIAVDTSGYVTNFSFVDFFTSLQDWYDVYRFASPVNTVDTLLQKDTTITVSSLNIPFSFKYLGTRLQDETISTVLGNYDCKKFLTQWEVKAYILFQEITLLTTNDTIWIAPDNWIVQDIIPGQYLEINIYPFIQIEQAIPGLDTRLTDEIVSVAKEEPIPNTFTLEQNYPNPFNPSTTIKFTIPSVIASGAKQSHLVVLKVFDILGNEVATLVNEEIPAGTYEVEFNSHSGEGRNLTSGVYFYQLKATPIGGQAVSFVETKKMVLMK
jgi:hypothetical protein